MLPRYRGYGGKQVFSRSQVVAAFVLALLPMAALMQGFWVVRQKAPYQSVALRFETEKVDCPYCGGAGTMRDPEDPDRVIMCPICYGVGGNYVRKLEQKIELLCPACVGMGRIYDVDTGHPRGCMRCEGRGLIEITPGSRIPVSTAPILDPPDTLY